MFLDDFFNNSWESNQDFSIENFNQEIIDQHAKLTEEAIQSLANKNLETIENTNQAISNNFAIANKILNQTATSIINTIKNFSLKVNEATLKFYNHYTGIQNTTYKVGLNTAGDNTRIDYDGNAVAFVDSLLEAFDELMVELNGYSIETENETDSLLETINAITNEYQNNTELALTNMKNTISAESTGTLNFILSSNLSFKEQITSSIESFFAKAINKWSPMGSNEGFIGGFLGKALDIGSWF